MDVFEERAIADDRNINKSADRLAVRAPAPQADFQRPDTAYPGMADHDRPAAQRRHGLVSAGEGPAHHGSQGGTMRILHALTGAAGQPWAVSRAQRRLGLHADCVRINDSRFGYQADRYIEIKGDEFESQARFISEVVDQYDVFHFYFRPFLYFDPRYLAFPSAMDLLALRAAGKTLVFHYRGSEVRLHSVFRDVSPYHYVDENPSQLVKTFPEQTVMALMRFVRGVCQKVLVPDPELQTYVPHAQIVPRAIDLGDWPYAGPRQETNPLVLHAPSRRTVKGTSHVLEAVKALKAEGLQFRFEMIENMENSAARRRYVEADIIIDQLRIGWYGVLAVEGMALGKAVVSYVRADLEHHLGDPPPLDIANPDTIKDVLRRLITDAPRRRQLGENARAYCERTHDADRVAAMLRDIYEDAARNPAPVDVPAVLEFIGFQKRMFEEFHALFKKALFKPGVFRRMKIAMDQRGPRYLARRVLQRLAKFDFH